MILDIFPDSSCLPPYASANKQQKNNNQTNPKSFCGAIPTLQIPSPHAHSVHPPLSLITLVATQRAAGFCRGHPCCQSQVGRLLSLRTSPKVRIHPAACCEPGGSARSPSPSSEDGGAAGTPVNSWSLYQ